MTNTAPQGPDQRALQYLDITDFSPGIYDNSVIAAGNPSVPGIFPAPPGAADASATFGCTVEQNGGLGPLPALGGLPGAAGLSLSDIGISITGTADISCLINTQQNSSDELVIGITDNYASTTQRVRFFDYLVGSASLNAITGAGGTFNYIANNKAFVAYPFMTTLDVTQINPSVILPLAAPDGPTSQLMNFPSQSALTAYGVDTITSNPQGSSFGHQGRIVTIQQNSYGWPRGVDEFPNEAFSYTDPAESQTWPQQYEIFGPENPYGYGAISSVSAGELFCVKRRGGAIIIQGDLNNPTVTALPGVQSTGPIYGHTGVDQNGTYYCVNLGGAWVWNGGNASLKISPQLDDRFFLCANPILNTTYYSYFAERWFQWMLFSNNAIYYAPTNSWWQLENPATVSYFWYVPGYLSRYMYVALPTVTSAAEKFLFCYDMRMARASYQWQSLPIRLAQRDHTMTVREVVIAASNAYGDAAPVVNVSLIDDKGNVSPLDTWTMTAGLDTVQTTRLNAATRQTTTVAILLEPSGTTHAPVIHRLSLGFRSREHIGIT